MAEQNVTPPQPATNGLLELDTYYGVGYRYVSTPQGLEVTGMSDQTAAQGVLRVGDIITSVEVNGAFEPTTKHGIMINGTTGKECTPVTFKRLRDGDEEEISMDRTKFRAYGLHFFDPNKVIMSDPDAPECNATMSRNDFDGFESGLPFAAPAGRIRT